MRDWLTRNPRMTTTLVAGGSAVLLAVAIGLGFAVLRAPPQTGDASAGPSASAMHSASLTPDASPSSTLGSTASVIPDSADDPLMQVNVNGLRMRASPSTSADVLRSLDRGEVVRLRGGGAVEADGFAWHEVIDLDSQIGWVAMGKGVGGPWLVAVPAEPATSELLLRFQRDCDVSPRSSGGPTVFPPDLTLTADGRVVVGWTSPVVRQLSPSGLAKIRRDVLDLAVLQTSANYSLEQLPNIPDPPGHGVCVNTFWLGEGASRVVVNAVAWLDQEEGVYWVPSPERRALDELALHFLDVDAWLGSAAWSEPVGRAYVGASYLFWLELPIDTPPPPGVVAPSVVGAAWPFDGPIEAFGDLVEQGRCGYLTLGQAFETLRLMRERGVPAFAFGEASPPLSLDGIGSGTFTTDAGWSSFFLTPRSPDGYPGCPN